MRSAREFVEDYRRKGYPDDRIRIIASMRPEPLRTEALKILEENVQVEPAVEIPPVAADAPTQVDERPVETPPLKLETPVEAAEIAQPEPEKPAVRKQAVASEARSHSDELKGLRRDLAAVRKEREHAAAELKKTSAELERLRAESTDAGKLRARVAELESIRKELEETRTQRRDVTSAKAELENRLAEIEAKLVQKESLLAEKDQILSELEESLAVERKERESAVERAAALALAMEEQRDRVSELEAVSRKLDTANTELEELRNTVSVLRESEQAKAERLDEIEAEFETARGAADRLREQLELNEQAMEQLQERLASRESELESLRTHFDREAGDLKKRADQEMWLVQRRLRRVHRLAGVAGAAIICLLAVAIFSFFRGGDKAAGNMAQEPGPAEQDQDIARTPSPVDDNLRQDTININPRRNSITQPQTTTTTLHIAEAPPARPTTKVVPYTVRRGDSLSSISQRFFGDSTHVNDIARENNIANPAVIRVGMELKITVPVE